MTRAIGLDGRSGGVPAVATAAVLLAAVVSTCRADPWQAVTDQTPLKPGDKVQVQWLQDWIDAEVVELDRSGWVRLRFSDPSFPQHEMTASRPRSHLRIAAPPPVVPRVGTTDNPFEPVTRTRTWTDSTGKYHIEAELLELTEEVVRLRRTDSQEVTVPLARLSREDREYLKGFAAGARAQSDNPFEPNKSQAETGDVGPPVRKADWSSAVSVLLDARPAPSNLAPDGAVASPDQTTEAVILPGTRSFHEHVTRLLPASHKTTRAVVTIENLFEHSARHWLCLLVRGGSSVIELHAPGNVLAMDLGPEGDLLLTEPVEPVRQQPGRVDLWRIAGRKLEHVVGWEPDPSDPIGVRGMSWGAILDPEHVLTCTSRGKLVLWKLPEVQAVYAMALSGTQPVLSPGRKYLALALPGGLAVVEALSGKVVGWYAAEGMNGGTPAFRPDGARLALVTRGRVVVWDFADGRLYRDLGVSIDAWRGGVVWSSDEFLLLDGSWLVDLARYAVVWEYRGIQQHHAPIAANIGRQFWYCADALSVLALVPLSLPHAAARQTIEQLGPELALAVEPGKTVSLNLQIDAPPDQLRQISGSLQRRLEANGLSVAPEQPVEFVARTRLGKQEETAYHGFRLFPRRDLDTVRFQQHISEVNCVVDGHIAWSVSSVTAAPTMLRIEEGESVEQALARYSKPNLAFFDAVSFPRCIAQPREPQALGASQLTPQGPQPAALRPRGPQRQQPSQDASFGRQT